MSSSSNSSGCGSDNGRRRCSGGDTEPWQLSNEAGALKKVEHTMYLVYWTRRRGEEDQESEIEAEREAKGRRAPQLRKEEKILEYGGK